MATKPRPPITTAEEIIAWAEKTREANGEAFTMLTKDEQLLIAKFILAMRDHIKTLQNGTGMQQKPEVEEGGKNAPCPKADESVPSDRTVVEEVKRQSNMEYFIANKVPMQRAFQLYETWAKCDTDNRYVIDEDRHAYVKSAGFAFWLHLPHE